MRIPVCTRWLLIALVLVALPLSLSAQVFITVGYPPPPLPVYEQPLCPAPGYIWAPGYWAYGPYGYYWVPGTWVLAPVTGYLWTPGYWGWDADGDDFMWHDGYWAPQVGYYGGINYGYGYTGYGYQGGYWRGQQFYYNRSVNNVNVTNVRNVYNTRVENNTNVTRVSYNGGSGGVMARPTPEQESVLRERHVAPTSIQLQHQQTAQSDRNEWATVNHGRPAIAATPKPAAFHGPGVVPARNAPVNTMATNPKAVTNNPSHPTYGAVPPANRPVETPHNVPRPPAHENQPYPAPHTNEGYKPPPHPTQQTAPHTTQPVHPGNPGYGQHPTSPESVRETPRTSPYTYSNEPAPHASQAPQPHTSPQYQAAPRVPSGGEQQSAPHSSNPQHKGGEPQGRG